jgi:hypothetical protein
MKIVRIALAGLMLAGMQAIAPAHPRMGLEVVEDFMVEVATSAEVILAGIMDGEAVATAGTVAVTAGGAAVHMAVGIGAVGTGAAGTGTEVARIGGGIILTVTAL